MDRDQMLSQLGIELPGLPPKPEDPNAPVYAFPVNPANPEGNWTDSRINTINGPVWPLNNYSTVCGLFPDRSLQELEIIPIDSPDENGRIITTPEEWWNKRRPEIKKDLEKEQAVNT
jgi:hypothetical protein